jgi:hypothetical protein
VACGRDCGGVDVLARCRCRRGQRPRHLEQDRGSGEPDVTALEQQTQAGDVAAVAALQELSGPPGIVARPVDSLQRESYHVRVDHSADDRDRRTLLRSWNGVGPQPTGRFVGEHLCCLLRQPQPADEFRVEIAAVAPNSSRIAGLSYATKNGVALA